MTKNDNIVENTEGHSSSDSDENESGNGEIFSQAVEMTTKMLIRTFTTFQLNKLYLSSL